VNYLLDTHVLLWALSAPEKLTKEMRDIIEDPGESIWFSVASLWEVAIKSALGRPDFTFDAREIWGAARDTSFLELDVQALHVFKLRELPALHQDPFDRLLLAQANAMNMHLLTVDARVLQYSDDPAIGGSPSS
jgi:PIN domain nuclease of toxin-antitoxin system